MTDSQRVPPPDLTSPTGRQAIPSYVSGLTQADDAAGAVELIFALDAAPDAAALWRDNEPLLARAVLLALPLLPEERAVELIEQGLVTLIDADPVGLVNRLHLTLTGVPLRKRDAFKRRLVERLHQGTATLTTTPIETAAGTTQLPTVGAWTGAYLAAAKQTPSPDGFVAAQPNAAHLSSADRQRLVGFVKVLQRLLAPSTTLEGIEDEIPVRQLDGTFGVLEGGTVRPLGAPVAVAPALVLATASPRLAFHPEDEKEIAVHVGRLSQMALAPSSAEAADLVATAVLRSQRLAFEDPSLERRFRTALTAHLKGIRSRSETHDIVSRPAGSGGLGLTDTQAEAVLVAAAAEVAALTDPAALAALKARLAPPSPAPPPSLPPRPVPAASSPLPTGAPRPPAPGGLPYQPRPLPVRMARPRPVPADRTFVADVRAAGAVPRPRTMGPVEELKALTLEEFRTAGSTTTGIRKLKERFDSLAKESFALRVQSILGWRQSPLSKLYLALGQESMTAQQPISAVIAARQARGEPTVTEAEFAAIADLNQTLRF